VKQLLSSPLPLIYKHAIIRVFVLSVITYNAASWFGLSNRDVARLQAPLVRALRLAHRMFKDGKLTGDDSIVLRIAGFPCMHAMLA